jgi:hypothetical protein
MSARSAKLASRSGRLAAYRHAMRHTSSRPSAQRLQSWARAMASADEDDENEEPAAPASSSSSSPLKEGIEPNPGPGHGGDASTAPESRPCSSSSSPPVSSSSGSVSSSFAASSTSSSSAAASATAASSASAAGVDASSLKRVRDATPAAEARRSADSHESMESEAQLRAEAEQMQPRKKQKTISVFNQTEFLAAKRRTPRARQSVPGTSLMYEEFEIDDDEDEQEARKRCERLQQERYDEED